MSFPVDNRTRKTRVWRWWNEHIPAGTYDWPWSWFTRLLFCRPCHPMRDMCGIPEHDYCSVCGRSMPGEGAG